MALWVLCSLKRSIREVKNSERTNKKWKRCEKSNKSLQYTTRWIHPEQERTKANTRNERIPRKTKVNHGAWCMGLLAGGSSDRAVPSPRLARCWWLLRAPTGAQHWDTTSHVLWDKAQTRRKKKYIYIITRQSAADRDFLLPWMTVIYLLCRTACAGKALVWNPPNE